MQRLVLFMALALAMPTTLFAHASASHRFPENDYYRVLPGSASAQPVVTEYFSFFCGHCQRFEPLMELLAKSLPAEVKFTKIHVDFLPKGDPAAADLFSTALYVARALEVTDQMLPKLFAVAQSTQPQSYSTGQIRELFAEIGITKAEFNAAYAAILANNTLASMRKLQKQAVITKVPTVVVNGRYQVVTTKIKSAQEYLQLVNYLSGLN